MKETPTHLGHVLKVVVSLLQGSSSVQRLPHARVLAEEGLTVVLDPVHHLGEEEEEEEGQMKKKIQRSRSEGQSLKSFVFLRRCTQIYSPQSSSVSLLIS